MEYAGVTIPCIGVSMGVDICLTPKENIVHKQFLQLSFLAALATITSYAPDAFAAGDVVDRGNGLIEFLSHRLGPIIIGLGLIGGAGALIIGIPGAVQKIVGVIVGGILLTSIGSMIAIIEGF